MMDSCYSRSSFSPLGYRLRSHHRTLVVVAQFRTTAFFQNNSIDMYILLRRRVATQRRERQRGREKKERPLIFPCGMFYMGYPELTRKKRDPVAAIFPRCI